MNDFLEDRPTASYIYALHEDTDNPHAHVALTGERRDLYMNQEDIDQVRDHANEQPVEQYQHRSRSHEQDQGHDHEHGEEHEHQQDRSASADRDTGHEQGASHDAAEEDTDRSENRDTGGQSYGR